MKNSLVKVHIDSGFVGDLDNYKGDVPLPLDGIKSDRMDSVEDTVERVDLRNDTSADVEGSQVKGIKQKQVERLNETSEKLSQASILAEDGDTNGSTYHSCVDMKSLYLRGATKLARNDLLDKTDSLDKKDIDKADSSKNSESNRLLFSNNVASKDQSSKNSESNHSLFSNNVSKDHTSDKIDHSSKNSEHSLFSNNVSSDNTRSTSFNLTNSSNHLKTSLFPDTARLNSSVSPKSENHNNHSSTTKTSKTSLFPNIETTRPINSSVSPISENPSNNTRKASTSSLFANNLSNNEPNQSKLPGKGVFYIANSPSPPHDTKLEVPSNLTNSDLLSPIPPIKRQDSLFSNYQLIKDNHDDDEDYDDDDFTDSEDDDVEDVDVDDKQVRVVEEEEYDYTSTDISEDDEDFYSSEDEKIQLKDQPIEQPRSKPKSKADDDSEWLSVTSEDDERLDIKISDTMPLQFKKIQPRAHTDSAALSHSTPIPMQRHQKRNSTPTLQKPRSLLSGLFLNELPNKANVTPEMSKPILKTSTQTGIITVEQSRINPATTTQVKRPSILFLKKFSSFSDISKNYPHYHNNLVKDNILNDIPNRDDGEVLGKQRSMVGLSQYNVTTKNATNRLSDSTKSGETIVFTSSSYNETLSSSLNKFSDAVSHTRNVSNTSLKNLLSKSSLNLSKMYNTSMSRFNKSDTSFSDKSSCSTIANGIFHHSKTTSLDQTNRLGHTKLNVHNATQDIKHDAQTQPQSDINGHEISPKLLSPHSLATPIATSLGSKKSNHSEGPNPKFTLSPKTTRKAMLSTELSESLKESIIIDYKLGKIPLPAKVINDRNIIGSQLVVDDDDNGYDDYHSKGW